MAEITASKLRNTIDNIKQQRSNEAVVRVLEVVLDEIESIKRDVAELEKKVR